MNDNEKKELADLLIKSHGVVVQSDPIKLSSGKLTNHYYDVKAAILTPRGTKLVGELGLQAATQLEAKSVGGLELGAIPIATLIARESEGTVNPIPAFFVRKTAKAHGLQKYLEGSQVQSPALIVDDVVTTGTSTMQAVRAVRELGCKIAGVMAIVDREEDGETLFSENGIPFYSIFTDSDFKEYIDTRKSALGINPEAYLRQV